MRARARTSIGLILFNTSIGRCRIAWGDRGITRVQILGASEADDDGAPASASSTSSRASGALPPPWVTDAIERITRHLAGDSDDLTSIAIDMEGVAPFFRRVYEAARSVGPGETISYAELAELAGSPKAVRAVGQAMAKNPFPLVVPCHRVLAAGGKSGGFSAPGGVTTKLRLLDIELGR